MHRPHMHKRCKMFYEMNKLQLLTYLCTPSDNPKFALWHLLIRHYFSEAPKEGCNKTKSFCCTPHMFVFYFSTTKSSICASYFLRVATADCLSSAICARSFLSSSSARAISAALFALRVAISFFVSSITS